MFLFYPKRLLHKQIARVRARGAAPVLLGKTGVDGCLLPLQALGRSDAGGLAAGIDRLRRARAGLGLPAVGPRLLRGRRRRHA